MIKYHTVIIYLLKQIFIILEIVPGFVSCIRAKDLINASFKNTFIPVDPDNDEVRKKNEDFGNLTRTLSAWPQCGHIALKSIETKI